MTDYLTEQEQIELIKSWIKQYSFVILSGIFIAIILTTGWRYWHQRQENILKRASIGYEEMIAAHTQNNTRVAEQAAKKIYDQYPDLAYGQMAALMLARENITQHDFKHAEAHLNWVMTHSSIPALRQIARIRLARLFIAQHKPRNGLQVLEKIDDKRFNGLIEEVRGDAFFDLHELTKARESYHLALSTIPNAEVIRPLLQMKFENLNAGSST